MNQPTLRQLDRIFSLLNNRRYLRKKFYSFEPHDIADLLTKFRLMWEYLDVDDDRKRYILVHTLYYDNDDNFGVYERLITLTKLVRIHGTSQPWSMRISTPEIHNQVEFMEEVA